MTEPNPNIYDLNMSDTEYAALVAKGYDPNFERDLTEENPDL